MSGIDHDRLEADYAKFEEMAMDAGFARPVFDTWLRQQPLGYRQAFGVWTEVEQNIAARSHRTRLAHMRRRPFGSAAFE